jgi:hypothetical protein
MVNVFVEKRLLAYQHSLKKFLTGKIIDLYGFLLSERNCSKVQSPDRGYFFSKDLLLFLIKKIKKNIFSICFFFIFFNFFCQKTRVNPLREKKNPYHGKKTPIMGVMGLDLRESIIIT